MLDKLTQTFSGALRVISGRAVITEKNIEDAAEAIKLALLEADVNLRAVRRFVNATVEEARGEKVLRSVDPGQQFVKIVHDRLVSFLGGGEGAAPPGLNLKGPDTLSTVLMLGLQGSGKTTSSAKLALRLKKEGRRPLLAACDLVRPAAVEQLSLLGEQTGVPVYSEPGAVDPVAVYKGALARARRELQDTLIIDTAGRLQIDGPLMEELARLRDAARPEETLLVADAMTGQAAADIAKAFDEKIGLTGVVLTKFDSDTRGGAALSLKTVTGKALKFVGTGEKPGDFEPFHPDRVAGRILGMGDVVGLVEKAQEVMNQEEARELQHKMEKENLTLEDWLGQMRAVKKMGSLRKLVEMFPGMAGRFSEEEINREDIKRQEAILSSMTRKERANYLIIGPSRRGRIARGSGTSAAEVGRLIKKFEKIRTMMKKMAKMSKTPAGMQEMMRRMGEG